MDIYTPDELLHQAHAQQQQHDRFMTRSLTIAAGNGHDPLDRKRFGQDIQNAVAIKLRAAGYSVSAAHANEHFDLLVNGLRVEVKAAARSGQRYAAALRRNDADVLILCCRAPRTLGEGLGVREDGGEDVTDHYFIIPFDDVRGRTHIKISQTDPTAYTGRFRVWYEAWQLIDQLIARGVNYWQPTLL